MNSEKNILAGELRAQGMPQTEIAEKLGVSHPTISRALQKPEVKEVTERETLRLLKALPDITQTTIDTICIGKHLTKMYVRALTGNLSKIECARLEVLGDSVFKMISLADKKGSRLNRAMGIEESRALSIIFQQFNQTNNLKLSSVMQQALSSFMKPEEIEDAEYTESETEKEY